MCKFFFYRRRRNGSKMQLKCNPSPLKVFVYGPQAEGIVQSKSYIYLEYVICFI